MKKEKIILIGITLIAILLGLKPFNVKASTYTPGTVQMNILRTSATGTSFVASDYSYNGTCAVGANCYTRNSSYTTPGANGNYFWRGNRIIIPKGNTNYLDQNSYKIKLVIEMTKRTYFDYLKTYNEIRIYGKDLSNDESQEHFTSKSCRYVPNESNINRYTLTCDVIPNTNLKEIRIVILWSAEIANLYASYEDYEGYMGRSVINTKLVSINIEESEGIGSKIDETNNLINNLEDVIIQNNINIENTINGLIEQEHEYETEDITEDVEDLHDQQEEIKENLDLSTTDKLTFRWETTTINWIWAKVQTWIISNTYLNTIMTSFMALGIIKLILGR